MLQKLLSLRRKINQPNDTVFLKVFNHWCFHVIYWKFPTQISLWKMMWSVNISCCQKWIPQEQKPDLSTKNRNTGEQIITKKSSCLGENGFDLSWLFWYPQNHTVFLFMRSWCLPDNLQHGHICWYMAFQRCIKWYCQLLWDSLRAWNNYSKGSGRHTSWLQYLPVKKDLSEFGPAKHSLPQ